MLKTKKTSCSHFLFILIRTIKLSATFGQFLSALIKNIYIYIKYLMNRCATEYEIVSEDNAPDLNEALI